MNKFQVLNVLNNINPITILRKRQKVEHNKITISHSTIINVLAKELPCLVKEMPNFLEYEIYEFQKATKNGEFTFPENHAIGKCITWYFQDMARDLGLIK